ncbi:L-type lectin-domain containing receptor kinase IX.1-like [Papaver somniferum]|uniref:L-type lectin-domain containing receptor kinase IX.1-like n=1 Tax=Papaver somniferum TaxID=3469 RepID=UPI000E7032B3|nr:L-type lectin-domain containing receptor kinase IX.1-like [Papaver somniferum]
MKTNISVHLILLIGIVFALNSIELALTLNKFEDCKPKDCGNGLNISYPFWIKEDYCGDPGFEVTCKNNEPILYTAGYDYIIRDIRPIDRSFRVENSVAYGSCPVPFKNSTFNSTFNYDQSPFKSGSQVQDLTFFYNCTHSDSNLFENFTYPVNTSCVTLPDPDLFSFAGIVPNGKSIYDKLKCQFSVHVPVEVELNQTEGPVNDYLPLLKKSFTLEWDQTRCGWCQETGESCGLDDNDHLVCFAQGRPSRAMKVVVQMSMGAAALVGLGIGIAFCIWFKKRCTSRNFNAEIENWGMSMEEEFQKGTGPRRFSYKELVDATSNFDDRGKLGQGGFGAVYKGSLSDMNVAVKRISKESQQGKREYQSEVRIISRLRHRNLVQLIGWCHERNELLLVYEFMPNKSLDKHLFQGENVLSWEVRYKVALGLASGLLYLHEEWEQCVVHRDIKSSNIMLDSDFNAKLGDFGLARLVDHGKGSQTTAIAGTRGYLAPECLITGKFSKESDIYSFGIVALEIASGRKPAEIGKMDLVEWVWGLYGSEKLIEAVDKRLKMKFDESEMVHLLIAGLWCAHPDYKSRPSISEVINVLKFESPLPMLPLELPPVYLTTAVPSGPRSPSLTSLTDTLTGR